MFEWGMYSSAPAVFIVSFGRITILDQDDDYDRREQLNCELVFAASAQLQALGAGVVWSEQHLDLWFAEVEQSDGLTALRAGNPKSGNPKSIKVEQKHPMRAPR